MDDQSLAVMSGLFEIMTAELVADRNIWDDCVQEARIAVWRVSCRGGTHPPAYFHTVARRRIAEVATRQTWFGHSGRNGYPVDPLRRPHLSLDDLAERGLEVAA